MDDLLHALINYEFVKAQDLVQASPKFYGSLTKRVRFRLYNVKSKEASDVSNDSKN